MNPVVKVLVSLAIAAAAWAIITLVPAVPLPVVLAAATLITALLVSVQPGAAVAYNAQSADEEQQSPSVAQGPRESGEVKWFNGSKGFGFITKDTGEEIFVHFRSIRGEGRRSLNEGQRVTFVESNTEKGPQAEDVEAL